MTTRSGTESGTRPHRSPRGRWRGDPILVLVLGVVLAYLAVNGGMLWFSLDAAPQLVTPDYYAQSQQYGAVVSARQASGRTGWRLEPDAPLPGGQALSLRILEAGGQPVSGLSGTAQAYRPADAALDQVLTWSEDPAQPGRYLGVFARPAPGLWRITVDLRRGGERFYESFPFVSPADTRTGAAPAQSPGRG